MNRFQLIDQTARRHHPRQAGVSLIQLLLFCLLGLSLLLGGTALYSTSAARRPAAATTFIGWYEDKPGYEKALADLHTTHRPVLLYIYAPWCPHCQHFSAEVLANPKVENFLKDYPHVKVAPDHGNEEKKIMLDFGAQGYPAFYVILPDGSHVQVLTYVEGETPHQKSPKEFIRSVLEATHGK